MKKYFYWYKLIVMRWVGRIDYGRMLWGKMKFCGKIMCSVGVVDNDGKV